MPNTPGFDGEQPAEEAKPFGLMPDYPILENQSNLHEITAELGTWLMNYFYKHATIHVFNNQPGISCSVYNVVGLESIRLREERSNLVNILNYRSGYLDLINPHSAVNSDLTNEEIINKIYVINNKLFDLFHTKLNTSSIVFEITGERVHPSCSLTLGAVRSSLDDLIRNFNSSIDSFNFSYVYETTTTEVDVAISAMPIDFFYRFTIQIQKT